MNKDNIIKEKLSLIEWVSSLKSLSNDVWFSSFKKGTWGISDVISHFISWDKFLLENRLPYLLKDEGFPQLAIDVEAINKEASNYARSGITKEKLISEFISVREELVSQIGEIQSEKFEQPFPGKEGLTLSDYFVGLIEHDAKHKRQIDAHVK